MRIAYVFALFFGLLLSAGCGSKKDNTTPAPEKKTPVEIHINHTYRNYGTYGVKGIYLGVLYNRVIAEPVTFKVQISRTDGKPDTVITTVIPSGFKNLVRSDIAGNGIMNLYEKYIGDGYKEGIKILSIDCENKQLSFSEDRDPENHLDFITLADFKSNDIAIRYHGYSEFTGMDFLKSNKTYAFSAGKELRAISETGQQPTLFVGQQIKMPYFRYYYRGDHGTELNNMEEIAEGSGSTVVFTIIRVGDKSFDATFSGKVWSKNESDTLVIREGILTNAMLPRAH